MLLRLSCCSVLSFILYFRCLCNALLQLRLASSASDLLYAENSVVVAPDGQPGWDLVVCGKDNHFHFEQVKVAMPGKFKTVEELLAHSLEGTLRCHLDSLGTRATPQQPQQQSMLSQQQSVASQEEVEEEKKEKKRVALNKVKFVLSIADRGQSNWTKCSAEDMVAVLQQGGEGQEAGSSSESNVVLRYVQQFWHNVGYLDWAAMASTMPPVLVPFAQLAHAALREDEEKEQD